MSTTEPAAGTDLESLKQEREFLLRSLADLDAEYQAGDIEEKDYRSLTDDYTARAAAVLRAIDGSARPGRPTPSDRFSSSAVPPRRQRSRLDSPVADQRAGVATAGLRSRRRWRTAAVVIVVIGFGALAAWAVSQSSGSRSPGQTASGNSQLTTGSTIIGGVDERLLQARLQVNQGKVAEALKLYDAVLKDDPNQPVALALGGWLEAQAGLAANRPELVDTGLVKIERAEKVDPGFADPHFFRGFLLLRAKHDAPGAVTELRVYLGSVDPSSPQVSTVQAVLQEAIKAAGANVPPGPNAPTTTTAKP